MGFGKVFKKFIRPLAPAVALIPGIGLPTAVALGAGIGALGGGGLKGALTGGLGAGALGGGGALLGSALGAGNGAAANALGTGLLGAGAGAASGGLKGALLGGVAGGLGGYASGGGFDGLGESLGLTGQGGLFSSGSDIASNGLQVGKLYDGTAADASFLNSARQAAGLGTNTGGGFLTGLKDAIGLGGAGGGGSSYGGLQTIGSAIGGLNSLNANDEAQKDLLSAQNNAMGAIAPYQQSGVAANEKLSNLLGTGDSQISSEEILASNPAYKFQLEQGNQALDRAQAARGGFFSGAALRGAQEFGQGLANQTAQQYQDNLARQSASGQAAANTAGNIYSNIGDAKANARIASSGIFSQTLASMLRGSGRPYIDENGRLAYA